MNHIGKLDRRITIYARTLTKDEAGGMVESWTIKGKLWAEKIDERGKESTVASADRGQNATRWRIRYRDFLNGLDEKSGHRLVYQGQIFDIVGTKEEGRRDALVLETIATQGTV